MRGYNDDLVMSLGIGLWIRDTAIRMRSEQSALTKQSLNLITKTSSPNINLPFYSGGSIQTDPYTLKIGQNQEDLRWLLDK